MRRNRYYDNQRDWGAQSELGNNRRGFRSRTNRFSRRGSAYDNGAYNGYGYNRGFRNNGGYGYQNEPPRHFWNRNDGYNNYYGSEEYKDTSITSKILGFLSGLHNKTKSPAKKLPAASSSNAQYDSAEVTGDYTTSGVSIQI